LNKVEAALSVFAVYEPPLTSGDRADRAERLIFIKDSFIWSAAILPAVWLLFKRLWLELFAFVALAAILTWGVEAAGAPAALGALLLFIVQIVLGFEAGTLQGAALERRGWRFAGTVAGRNRLECERRFLESWLPAQSADQFPPAPTPDRHSRITSWTATAWNGLARGRRLTGAKA
jgi:hypothetical protein